MSDVNESFEDINKALAGIVGITIEFKRDDDGGFNVTFSTDDESAIDEMSKDELFRYRDALEEKIDELDTEEPDDETPEHEEWGYCTRSWRINWMM